MHLPTHPKTSRQVLIRISGNSPVYPNDIAPNNFPDNKGPNLLEDVDRSEDWVTTVE
jgi:hypothetical protein